MRNKHLFLAAASALVLAACSSEADTPNIPDNDTPDSEAVTLKTLSASSQSGRVARFGTTRGEKAERLQLVAKIAPVADAADYLWSATGISIQNGKAYVSWHSNRQASDAALAWGGAIDEIDIERLAITLTQTSDEMKFNNVVANGTNLYLPMTSWKKGAAVGRVAIGSEKMDTLSVHGSSVNYLAVNAGEIYAVAGFKGGVYKFPANFENGNRACIDTLAMAEDFGGKFIDGKYVLRTDAEKSYIFNSSTKETRELGMPLTSEEKYAEEYRYNEALGKHEWVVETGSKAAYYGKHTMAYDGEYFYVAGGKGGDGKNGLRVYDNEKLVWENGSNTTAVCFDDNYVYAATGDGLRVYKKYDTEKGLELYAFEVKGYGEDGKAPQAPEGETLAAGTDAHSCNFIAVDPATGLIFVANGQTGVSVFRLNSEAAPAE